MAQTRIHDLQAFVAVARDRSFTKAAGRFGVTPSALSHTVRALEERLGVRLLARTTRNVAPTDAGERLLAGIGPLFDQIAEQVEAIGALGGRPRGTIRVTCTDDQIQQCLRPMLAPFLAAHPDITLELYVDYGFQDVVEERFDAGIRMGEAVSKDMVAVRIGPDWRMRVVGAPAYFARHAAPRTPHDLTRHVCINTRYRPSSALYAWDFERDGKAFTVKVDGPLAMNSTIQQLDAALDGIGLAYIPEALVLPHLAAKRLRAVLTPWCPWFEGFHLYYPNRRQASPALAAFVQAVRYRG